ncbi:MAG: AAA family ATPase [Dehalococcoidia bacterium]|nr:AAA family ATPase [Dehalococcoidia bacterium]
MGRTLTAEDVRRVFSPDKLGFETTEGLEPVKGIIGQARALQALDFGLEVSDAGFNIYAAGRTGTGKMSAIVAFLEKTAQGKDVPSDWCYVNNFQDAYRPQAIRLSAGKGIQFHRDMKRFIETARDDVKKAFESEDYTRRRDALAGELNERRQKVFSQLNQTARESGFAIQMSPIGILLVPVVQGRPLSQEEMLALSPGEREQLSRKQEGIQEKIKEAMNQMRTWEGDLSQEIDRMDLEVVEFVLGGRIQDLTRKYGGESPEIPEYLKAVQDDIVENKNLFRSPPEAEAANPFARMMITQAMRKYEVNVLVDNSHLKGAPVVIENNPTFNNLIGRLEKEAQFGAISADFTMIRPGALHRANGGYLVLRMEDVLRNVFSWEGLKRAAREQKVVVEDLAERYGFISMKSIQPEAIPLKIKIILIGENILYHALHYYDREFPELFKVKAEFDSRMDFSEQNVGQYAAALCLVCGKEELRHLDAGAVSKVIEHSSRLAEDQRKLSAQFAEIADIVREANYWAGTKGKKYIEAADISRAIEQKEYRSNLIQEHIQEMMDRELLKIQTRGSAVGQVNGLSVISLGDLYFGRPNRITASIAAGREGLIDIERESKLGGRLHTKGVLILSGLLAERYAMNIPLTLSARIVFEQSYEEVDGDSASGAELYALLSALADAPIRQGVAVTGSVNQKGEAQAIGGVNQKIEGFYDICRIRGLTGNEGVMIPESNVENLMLREDLVEAIRRGEFFVHSVATIDEGIEFLTGIKAGQRLEDGKFEEGSINRRVQDRLEKFAKGMREFMRENGGRPAKEREEALAGTGTVEEEE